MLLQTVAYDYSREGGRERERGTGRKREDEILLFIKHNKLTCQIFQENQQV